MDRETIEAHLAAFAGAEASCPFGPEALVFKVHDKIFAIVSQLGEPPSISLKCIPTDGALLVDHFKSVTPGYHLNKKHWITVELNGELPDDTVFDLCSTSYQLIISKLPKKIHYQLVFL
jgi:predicted DNA-binding protein (MmcQ/YjbR family)